MDSRVKILGVTLILALIYIIFLKGCGDKHSCPDPEIVTIVRIDSSTYVDTVKFEVEKFKYVTVKIPMPYYDTILTQLPENFDESDCDFILKYASIYEDSIKNDTIALYYKARVRGFLDELTLGHKIFTPFYIEKTTLIETEVVKKKAFNGFYLGMDVGIIKDSLSHVTPTLEASFRRFNYNIGFDLMDKDIIVGARFKIGK